jgi:hypothetical protein
MPYIAMMDRLRRFLSTPSSALIIVGYSFRDQHLNDVIVQGLQGTPSAVVFALMCDPLSNCPTAISLAKERANLCLIAKDGAVIRTKETLWGEAEEQPDLTLPGGAVEWTKGPGANDSWKATFNLGDFRIFGSFLQDISGIKDTGK